MRTPKKPLAAWIVQNREAQDPPWKSDELARRLGVSDSTVRGWEAGRSVSEPNLVAMERLFGVTAPGSAATSTDQTLVEALTRQSEAIEALVREMQWARVAQMESAEVTLRALGSLGARPDLEGMHVEGAPDTRVGTPR